MEENENSLHFAQEHENILTRVFSLEKFQL